MTVVRCPVPGTYLVREEVEPIPFGQTESSYSVIVHCYQFGWVCEKCGYRSRVAAREGFVEGTTMPHCHHVLAAQTELTQS
jgi:hypothetical protein